MTDCGLGSAFGVPDLSSGTSNWTYATAARAGEDHDTCDDCCVCEVVGGTLLAAVADGAGSAASARLGAAIACEAFIELGHQIHNEMVDPGCLISAIHERIPGKDREAHSATLVGVVADANGALFIQVGDGAAVFRTESRSPTSNYLLAIWPEETEFLNDTFFITASDAEKHLRIRREDGPVDEIALFSDGLQHLVVDRRSRQPHAPFFESLFKALSSQSGRDDVACAWLERTLASEPVTKRTGDDTSIVIARRLRC